MNATTTNQPAKKNPPPTNRREEDLNDNIQDGDSRWKIPNQNSSQCNKDTPTPKHPPIPNLAQLPIRYCYYFHKDNQILRYAGSVDLLVKSNVSKHRIIRFHGGIESQGVAKTSLWRSYFKCEKID